MFWDNAAAEQLLAERYPWFLDTWRMYPRVVHRGAAHPPGITTLSGSETVRGPIHPPHSKVLHKASSAVMIPD